ncbi:MAG TPA: heme ABC exporter ATP-binding protein CcmA [Polyangiaceae bacterium]|jgi:heme exporter protein A|nr:heme ABC exporter ATP-binding protein CcmA [Polyangiaceae bacterium]HQF22921.1 heme ABC exporter ATP-binding protein CcmA [Polyangiaceae bacterium]
MGESVSAVVLERVGQVYGGTAVLRGLSGRMQKGVLHLLVGPNGSGKSTLLRIVAGLLSPSFGQVEYEGVARSRIREAIGLVSHELLTYGELTVEENLRLGSGLYAAGEQDVEQAMNRFGLGAVRDRMVSKLSRGQRQRVSLARALLHRPSLVLLDEPTTGLDEQGVAAIVRVVRQEVASERVVIVVTHDPSYFDIRERQIWRLEKGRWA